MPKQASMFLEVLNDMRMYRDSDEYREARARYEERYQGRAKIKRVKQSDQVDEEVKAVPIAYNSFAVDNNKDSIGEFTVRFEPRALTEGNRTAQD